MDIKRSNAESRALWNRKAQFWDALHGDEGNAFHRQLVEPSVLNLLDLQAGESVLDIGCGSGVLARRLASLGARVTAVDFSDRMIEMARRRGSPQSEAIDYRLCDATDESALKQLGAGSYDALVCVMALMDMPTIEALFAAAGALLRSGGRFVFATMHPAFNSNNPIFLHEKEDRDGTVSEHYAVKIAQYLDMPPVKGSGAPGEPNPHIYYHRPLAELLAPAFANGFALDGLLEPAFSDTGATSDDALSWTRFPQIPPVLAGRLRPA